MLKQEFLKDQFLALLFCYIIRKSILKFMWPSQSKVYDDFHNPKRIELLARLKFGLSHLCDQKFKHSFQNKTLSPLCNYGIPSSLFRLSTWKDDPLEHSFVIHNIPDWNNVQLTEILLYGQKILDYINDTNILDVILNYLIETKRFDGQLFERYPTVKALI